MAVVAFVQEHGRCWQIHGDRAWITSELQMVPGGVSGALSVPATLRAGPASVRCRLECHGCGAVMYV
jgi:hypothetical protein